MQHSMTAHAGSTHEADGKDTNNGTSFGKSTSCQAGIGVCTAALQSCKGITGVQY